MSILRERANSDEDGASTCVNCTEIAATLQPVMAERMSGDDSDAQTSMGIAGCVGTGSVRCGACGLVRFRFEWILPA